MERNEVERQRQQAVRWYQDGVGVDEICRRLSRSRPWFYKWLQRFQSGEPRWFCDRPRSPRRVANKTAPERESEVIRVRRHLEKTRYAQTGALAIQWEMQKRGWDPLPTWTINRILQRHQLVRHKKTSPGNGRPYPDVRRLLSPSIQQMDLLGPRYLRGDGHFYSLNVIDLQSYLAALNPIRSKADWRVAESLLRSWKTIGRPHLLQMDNELSFRGSNRYPHSLGLVLRLCLALGVQPLFIPLGEPWRNGAIEKMQDIFDKVFFRIQAFQDYAHVQREARVFEHFRNHNHRCSAIGGQVPAEFVRRQRLALDCLPPSLSLSEVDLSLADGFVHLIRFIRSDRLLDVFGEKFPLPRSVQYEYVMASICTRTRALHVRLNQQLIRSFDYPIPVAYHRKC